MIRDDVTTHAPLIMQELMRHTSNGVVAFDRAHRYTMWNPAMERMTGLTAAAVLGQRAPDLFPFLREGGEDVAMERALGGARVQVTDVAFAIAASGRRGSYDATYFPVCDAAGAVIGGMAIVHDVTAKRAAERAAQETEARFRNMADVAPVLLWMAGTDGLCTFFNQTWLTFTGRTLEDEWGVGWAEGVHFEDFQRCMDTYADAFNARRVFQMEYRLRRADGEYRWILDRGTPRFESGGGFAGFIGSCVDITEMKRLEDELRASVKLRDEFLSIASHELRTPLTSLQFAIDSLVRGLTRDADHDTKLAKKARTVQHQAIRFDTLIATMLDVSRISEGRLELQHQDLDLAALVHEVAEQWRPHATKAGCALSVTVHGPLPGRWDRLRVEQVLSNLLGNAVKYGAGAPIDVKAWRADDGARVVVTDRGIGIAEADQGRIFERFERGVSSRHYGGFGLGLWIARTVVEAHGGCIAVESRAGQGATFTVSLPLPPLGAIPDLPAGAAPAKAASEVCS